MTRRGWLLGLALLIVTDAIVLVGVARNRMSETYARIELTQRELAFVSQWREDSGGRLRLVWTFLFETAVSGPSPSWFDRAKLESIGYDCSFPLEDESADLVYRKAQSRQVYAVLEYDGESWLKWLDHEKKDLEQTEAKVREGAQTAQVLEYARASLDRSGRNKSRLFAVDVGNDAAALRARYQDRQRYIVAPATVSLRLIKGYEANPSPPRLEGYVSQILVSEIHLSREQSRRLQGILDAWQQAELKTKGGYTQEEKECPRYAVVLRYGARHEPWIESISPLAPSDCAAPRTGPSPAR